MHHVAGARCACTPSEDKMDSPADATLTEYNNQPFIDEKKKISRLARMALPLRPPSFAHAQD